VSPGRKWISRHKFLSSLILIAALAAIAIIRWQATLSMLGNYLICAQSPQHSDLILVLAGDFYGTRVLKAAELATQGYAPLVLISGTPYQGRPEGEFAIRYLEKQGYPARLFESYGHNSRSTIEEAVALRPELARRHVQRVILVTSAYHSRRSYVVFRLFCPGIEFISVPGASPNYHATGWWTDDASSALFYSEWTKMLGTLLVAYPSDRIRQIFR
jgi:uncharacterized SAM-binding protein YcdF (DUF218 family)